jgi:hypothetical protein
MSEFGPRRELLITILGVHRTPKMGSAELCPNETITDAKRTVTDNRRHREELGEINSPALLLFPGFRLSNAPIVHGHLELQLVANDCALSTRLHRYSRAMTRRNAPTRHRGTRRGACQDRQARGPQ